MDNKQFEENLKIYNHLNSYLDILIKENDDNEKIAKDIISLSDEIESIRMRLFGSSSFPYNYCEIEFRGETEIELPEYGIEDFNRVLKDRMYFSIIGGSEESGFMFIKTKSFPDRFKMKLTFKKLDLFEKQSGKVNLIYNNKYYGPEESVFYEFKKLS